MTEGFGTPGIAEGIAQLFESVAPVREATLGYRQTLIEAGVDQLVADSMAADFHAMCMDTIRMATTKGMR